MANLINADPTNGLKLISDSSSEIQLQANGTTIATINSSGLSMNSGTMAGNGPAFSAYPSAQQTISSSTTTVVTCDTEEFDTASCFNNTGSTVGGIPAYSFMPNVAGYYMFSTTVSNEVSVSSTRFIISVRKNGVGNRVFDYQNTGTFNAPGTILYYLNGTTDYVDLTVYIAASTPKINAPFAQTRFQGFLVRAV